MFLFTACICSCFLFAVCRYRVSLLKMKMALVWTVKKIGKVTRLTVKLAEVAQKVATAAETGETGGGETIAEMQKEAEREIVTGAVAVIGEENELVLQGNETPVQIEVADRKQATEDATAVAASTAPLLPFQDLLGHPTLMHLNEVILLQEVAKHLLGSQPPNCSKKRCS
eukprot:Platyproteum_vivax@DN7673_c1_g3_i2.p1